MTNCHFLFYLQKHIELCLPLGKLSKMTSFEGGRGEAGGREGGDKLSSPNSVSSSGMLNIFKVNIQLIEFQKSSRKRRARKRLLSTGTRRLPGEGPFPRCACGSPTRGLAPKKSKEFTSRTGPNQQMDGARM